MNKIPNVLWEKFALRMRQLEPIIKFCPKILIAVSGGPDSIFLAYLLYKYSLKKNVKLFLVYINHGVRPEEEIKDDILVIKDFGNKFGLPLIIKKIPKTKKINENILRELRYKILTKIAKQFSCKLIALGHTNNDVVETVLLNLFRGTGLKGLAGIPFVRDLTPETSQKEKIFLFRPVIDIAKQDIIKVLKMFKIKYVVDKTNLYSDYTRNLIRNKLIPIIKTIKPNFETNIIKTTEIVSGMERYISDTLSILLEKIVIKKSRYQLHLDFENFLMYNKQIQNELLHHILNKIAVKYKIKFKSGYSPVIDKIQNFILSPKQSVLKLNKYLKLIKSKSILIYKICSCKK